MKVATSAQMKAIDARAIHEVGVPGVVLMENAGLRVVELIEAKFNRLRGLRVVVLCGRGNNGGDGFVIARHLVHAGALVHVYATASAEEFVGDAAIQRKICEKEALPVSDLTQGGEMEKLVQMVERSELVVDALLGTGLTGAPRGTVSAVIEQLATCPAPIVAVDVPSGVESDSGRVSGAAVRAQWTVTFGLPKVGLLIHPGCQFAGEVWLGEIGIPPSVIEEAELACNLITGEEVAAMLPCRAPDAHKGSCGKIGIVAGCARYAGAATLAARAAMRSGAGLVTLLVPASLNGIVRYGTVEATTIPMAETETGSIAEHGVDAVIPFLQERDALAIGPGLSRDEETLSAVRRILDAVSVPAVLDADALFAFAGQTASLRGYRFPKILTPHPGEMATLLGISPREVQENRLEVARTAAEQTEAVVILKGARTVVAAPDGQIFINPTGNAGMASGGTGDVLTGMVASLLGQGLDSLSAAVSAVYLHGLAGDLAAAAKGESALVASDLIESLPDAWKMTTAPVAAAQINNRLTRLA